MSLPTLVERLRREAPWFGDFQKAADLIDALGVELQRVTDHLETWTSDHSHDCTAEINAAIHCARAALTRARGESARDTLGKEDRTNGGTDG
jgi:hypothetical protein